VLALDAVHDAAPDMLGVDDIGAQDLVGVREKEIGAGQVDPEVPPELFDKLIDRCGRLGLREEIVFLVRHHEGLAVKKQLDIGVAAGAAGVDLVRGTCTLA
jgi:hypothetical protein